MARASSLASAMAGVVIIGTALVGCTPDVPAARTEPSPLPASGLPSGVTSDTDVPQDVPNDLALRTLVSVTGCEATDTGWEARGEFANPGTEAVAATISIFFTTESATVLAHGSVEATAAPGATEDWTVSAEFTAAPETLCVLRGVG